MRELSEGVVKSLRTATKGAEQVTVEFGVTISGKTSIVLVERSAAGSMARMPLVGACCNPHDDTRTTAWPLRLVLGPLYACLPS